MARGSAFVRTFALTVARADSPPPPARDSDRIGALTGANSQQLPQPAVVSIDPHGVARFVDSSADWLDRSGANAMLAAVATLAVTASAWPSARSRQCYRCGRLALSHCAIVVASATR